MNIKKIFINGLGEPTNFFALLMFSVLIATVLFIADTFYRNSCENYEEVSGKETIYKTLDGCYIKDSNGEWYYRD
jgi:hypothetical protein